MAERPPNTIEISAMVDRSAPTREIGAVLQGAFTGAGMAEFIIPLLDMQEYVPELTWPTSVGTFHRMRSDVQLGALYRGATLPIRRYTWTIDPNDAPDDMVLKLSQDLNLPIEGEEESQPRRRRKRRFIFGEHLRKALLALIYGHMFFEQVGEIGDDQMWHLRKLAERMPNTIAQISVAEDGGLVSIKQNIGGNMSAGNRGWFDMPEIPVDRLVAYVWDLEGANWFGRSLFRECYKNWLIKDRLMRIDAINHARAGGVPLATAPPGATPSEIEQLSKMAQDFRVGESAGGAAPYGTSFDIVRSSRSSTVESMQYHDEAMARFFLMMFMQLGQTRTGSRALGSSFIDWFKESQDTIASWFCDIFGEHVIEDWVDWNYGEDVEVVPMLAFKRDPELAVVDLANLIDKGAIVVDVDLENALRTELGLPKKAAGAPAPQPPSEKPPALPSPPNVPDGQVPPPPTPGKTAPVKADREREGVEGEAIPPALGDQRPPLKKTRKGKNGKHQSS